LNIFGLTPGELILIMMVAMVVIGPEKLPETAASVGKWVREFRRVTHELTQQFSDENPFTEIQRAFSLTEITNSLNAPLPGIELGVSDSATPLATEELSLVAATASVATADPPFRSYYFDQPAGSTPVEDSWTHSGLDDNVDHYGVGRKLALTDGVLDEWAHGVPLFVAIPVGVASDHQLLVEEEPLNSFSPIDLNGDAIADSVSTNEAATADDAVVAEPSRQAPGEEVDQASAPAESDPAKSLVSALSSAEPAAAGSVGPDRTPT
jgi:sec-independent protein translocase protein TatB